MSERRINLLLWTLAGICTAGAVASLALVVLVPLESATGDTMPATRPASQRLASRGMPSLAEYEPIFRAVLRPPAPDAQPSPEPAVAVDAAPAAAGAHQPALTLVGTIGQSLAMLRNERGEIEVKGVGDMAGGAKVVSIHTSRVEMQHNGRSIVLEKPKDPNPGS